MFQDVLQSIDGIEIYPLIGLILFIVIFTGVIIWTWKIDQRDIDEMSAIPFDSKPASKNEGE